MAKRNGFSELAKLLVRYPTQGQREKLKQLLLQNYTQESLLDYLTDEVAPTPVSYTHLTLPTIYSV